MAKKKTVKNTEAKKYGVVENSKGFEIKPARALTEAIFFGDLKEVNDFIRTQAEKKKKAEDKKKADKEEK